MLYNWSCKHSQLFPYISKNCKYSVWNNALEVRQIIANLEAEGERTEAGQQSSSVLLSQITSHFGISSCQTDEELQVSHCVQGGQPMKRGIT